MDNRILEQVLMASRRVSDTMPEETGVSTSLSDTEIKQYIEEVLGELHKKNHEKSENS
jgi:hypothetical protein